MIDLTGKWQVFYCCVDCDEPFVSNIFAHLNCCPECGQIGKRIHEDIEYTGFLYNKKVGIFRRQDGEGGEGVEYIEWKLKPTNTLSVEEEEERRNKEIEDSYPKPG